MKITKLLTAFLCAVLMFTAILTLSSCMKEEDYYTKSEVDALKAELEALADTKADECEAAIEALKAEHAAKISALEAESATNRSKISELTEAYNAKVEELENADIKNAEALAELEDKYDEAVAELNSAITENASQILALESDLEAKIKSQGEENSAAIEALKAEHAAKISALEAESATNRSKISELTEAYNAKIEELANADAENLEALAELEDKYDEAVAELNSAIAENASLISELERDLEEKIDEVKADYGEKISEVEELITALEEADVDNAARISILESQIQALLSRHEHTYGSWVDYSGNDGNISCENKLYYRICTECKVLEWKSGSYEDHSFITVTTPPTCVAGGYDTKTCSTCGKIEITNETAMSKLKHNYVDGYCTLCGAEAPLQYIRDGDYIYFGEYPQTLKADNVTITATVDERGYYLGSDGFYYAKVVSDLYRPSYKFSTGASITYGETYYFKVEPIRWRILSEDGETAFILCDSTIASQRYDASSNDYKNSEIRQWLNETFYETAFTAFQREIILTTTVDNSAASTGESSNPYACEDTEDKIFLLSYSEVTNSAYGFASSSSTYDVARRMQTSDYYRAMGGYMSTDSSYYGNDSWWLRSPYIYIGGVRLVGEDGSNEYYTYVAYDDPDGVNYCYIGVVPALQIRL